MVDCSRQIEAVCVMRFFFDGPATTEIYTLSLHDALPISADREAAGPSLVPMTTLTTLLAALAGFLSALAQLLRSEEHTSELQSRRDLVCRLLLEKKKNQSHSTIIEATQGTCPHQLI